MKGSAKLAELLHTAHTRVAPKGTAIRTQCRWGKKTDTPGGEAVNTWNVEP